MPGKVSRFIEKINRKFSVKLFVIFSIFIVCVSSTFTAFFINYQSKSLEDSIINKGKILVRLLAHNSKLGVFSESKEMLNELVDGILQQSEVIKISIFNHEGKLIIEKQKKGRSLQKEETHGKEPGLDHILDQLKKSDDPIFLDKEDRIAFWEPVISDSGYSTQESLFFSEVVPQKDYYVMGFVKLEMDKGILDERLRVLLVKSSIIGVFFFLIGLVVSYVIARRITGPLKRLTNAVNTLGQGNFVENVPVETKDEIGNLARALNHMSESLKKRETEKVELGEQLRHAQKMEAIGTLAGGLAHDFNNILTTILGNGALLYLKLDEKSPLRSYVKEILDSSDMAAKLTKNLLIYSRKQPIKLEPLNLNKHIEDIRICLERLIGEDIEFKVIHCGDDLMVMGDAGQIDQVLFNLVANARDAMPEGGILTISMESLEMNENTPLNNEEVKPGRYGLITVNDTGMGMESPLVDRIFDPFFTTKEVGKGTGLGLSMVYEIVKRHGGYIYVSSEPHQGTTFKLYLPLLDLKIPEEKEEPFTLPPGGTETMLFAEDNEKVRIFTKNVLEENGYTVIDVANGVDAIKKFLEYKDEIQLLLFDVIMPGKNGKDAYEAIRKIRPDIRVLFISGYDYELVYKKGIVEDDGLNFIYKPISPFNLLKKLREVLDK